MIRWLNGVGFPFVLSARALSDRNYYVFVSEGVRVLCERAEVYPCVLDAAVLAASGEGG